MTHRQHRVATDDHALAHRIPFDRAELEHSIVSRFANVVARCASQTAVCGNGEEWTYAELDRRSNQVARAILDRTSPGLGCVAYLVDHSPAMVICALGALKAAKAFLCLHPRLPTVAQRDVIRDAAPDLLLTAACHQTAAQAVAGDNRSLLLLEEIDSRYSAEPLDLAIKPGDPAVIYYTSGSTGQPKGIVKNHRTVLHRAWLCAQYDAISTADRQSLLTSCSFASSEADCFGALLNGAALELFDLGSRLTGLRTWIDERHITVLHPPVVLFRKYLSQLKGSGLHPSVRVVALAGEALIASDLQLWRRHFATSCALRHRLSSTEAGHIAVACVEPGATAMPGMVPALRPVADKFLSVVDDHGSPVEEGKSGELVIRSAYLADGYWRREQESADRFQIVPDHPGERLYRTGDMVRRLDGETLEFLGRRDTQVKIRGYRVETREIEQAFLTLPNVKEVAVIAEPRLGANILISFVVMQPGELFGAEALRSGLKTVLPEWKIPAQICPVESLPLTLTGKVDRQLLREYSRARDVPERGSNDPGP
jgi:amino acid adenylation domain-containing protein